MSSSISILFTLAVAAILALAVRLSQVGRRPRDLPPGPPTLPLIGNLHLMPRKDVHLQFQKWAEEYGPVYSLILGTKTMIVLNSGQAVKDLLDKRSAIYSSRPDNYISQDVASGGMRILLLKYGEPWKTIRKVAHRILNVKVSKTYVPYQDLESKAMLVGILEKPDQFISHIRRYTSSVTSQFTYGFRISRMEDPRLNQIFDVLNRMSEINGDQTGALLDVFPILQALPDAFLPIVRAGKENHHKEYNLYLGLFNDMKKKVANGTAKEPEGYSDLLAGYIAGSLLQAGSETTAAILVGFMQAITIFPEVVQAAHEELDRVCGDRLPDLDDVPDLPYIRGCMKESLRWMPTTFLGVPHSVTQNDEYMGYRIPKNAGIIYNVWTLNNDKELYPNPRNFDPARWLHDNQTSAQAAKNPDVSKRDHFVFGAGRRLCQGMHIADRNLFLVISRLLWAFDVRRAIDERTGQEIVPDMNDLEDGLFTQPKPFKANIVPREGKTLRVEEEWAKALELLDEDLQWKAIPKELVRVWKDYGDDDEEEQ